MDYRKFKNKYIIRLDKGEEIVETLKKFCEKHRIKLGSVSGIGASNKVELGLFEPKTKKYISRKMTDNYEITSLLGNISQMQGHVYLHLHISLGDAKQRCFSGHLNSAVVSATCEIVLEAIEGKVDRKFSQEIGLNLFEFAFVV